MELFQSSDVQTEERTDNRRGQKRSWQKDTSTQRQQVSFFAHSLARRAGKQVKSGTEYAILAGNVADTFWDTFPPPGTPHHQGLKLGGLVRCSLVIGGDVGLTVVVTL